MPRKPFNVLAEEIGPIQKIARLSWPIVISMALHNSYSIVDMYWVASLGKAEIAAVTLAGILFFVMFSISQIFGTGVHAIIARACGAGHVNRAGMILRDGILTALIVGIAAGFVLWDFPALIYSLLGAEPEVIDTGIPYLRIMVAGFAFTLPQFTLSAGFRATGDMTTAMVLTGVTVVINIILDPILIFGVGPVPALGLGGAAWATVISIVIAFVAGIAVLRNHHSLHGFRIYKRISFGVIREMFVIGLPSGAHYMLLSLNQTIMIRMVAEFGTVVIAAAGIGTRITHLAFLPCIGIGAATATLVGQYLGADKPQRAAFHVRRALQINAAVTAFICLLIALFPGWFMRIFTDAPDVIATGRIFLRIFAAGFMFVSTIIVLTRVFQGAGDTVWPALIVLCRLGVFLIAGYALGWLWNLDELGVWLAYASASAIQLLVIGWIYRLGTWKKRQLKET